MTKRKKKKKEEEEERNQRGNSADSIPSQMMDNGNDVDGFRQFLARQLLPTAE